MQPNIKKYFETLKCCNGRLLLHRVFPILISLLGNHNKPTAMNHPCCIQ